MIDNEFIAKVIWCVNDKLFQWLKKCARVTYAKDTTTSLTNFGNIFLKTLTTKFVYLLPTSVKILNRKEDELENKNNKKTHTNLDRVVNNNMNVDWKLRADEQCDTVFIYKSVNGPTLSMSCLPCLKFYCKRLCFKDCTNKISHKKLYNDDKVKTVAFIKSLRGDWYFGREPINILSYKIPPDKKVKGSENQSLLLINKKIHDETLEEDKEENVIVQMSHHKKQQSINWKRYSKVSLQRK